jgi:hypothetical protein
MRRLFLSVSVLTLAPLAASAQSSDAAYCAELSTLANRYLTNGTAQGAGTPGIEVREATLACGKGDYAAGIPVLERKLRANGFTLPKRG